MFVEFSEVRTVQCSLNTTVQFVQQCKVNNIQSGGNEGRICLLYGRTREDYSGSREDYMRTL